MPIAMASYDHFIPRQNNTAFSCIYYFRTNYKAGYFL